MEIWKPIIGYGDRYQISNYGNVISNNYNGTGLKKQLRKILFKTGYFHVTLFRENERNIISIHRLVALHFVRNKHSKAIVNHIDGNKQNNHFSNLQWVTHKENSKHAFDTGLMNKIIKSNLGNRYGESFRKVSIVVCHEDGSEEFFSNIREASHKYSISETAISNCLNKRSKTAGKKKWKYV